jgi:hypothetical protein
MRIFTSARRNAPKHWLLSRREKMLQIVCAPRRSKNWPIGNTRPVGIESSAFGGQLPQLATAKLPSKVSNRF